MSPDNQIDTYSSLSNIVLIKIILTILIFLSAFSGVLTPRLFNPFGNKISYANLIAAGVLVSGGFVHLLSDASTNLESAPLPRAAFNQPYPWSYFICAFTLLFLFILERMLVHHFLHHKHHHHDIDTNINKHIMQPHHTHHHGHQQQHTADTMELLQEKHYLTALILFFGLGLHSTLSGLALGASQNLKNIIVLGVAILSHKYLASFALGCSVYKSHIGKSFIFNICIAFFFATLTPIGIIIGLMLKFNGNHAWIPDLFICMASGTFLYVGIFEIIVPEFGEERKIERKMYNSMLINRNEAAIDPNCTTHCEAKHNDYADIFRICCLLSGFGIMSMLAIWV